MDPRMQNRNGRGQAEAGPSSFRGKNSYDPYKKFPNRVAPAGQTLTNHPKRWYPRDERDAQQFRGNHQQLSRSVSVSSDSSSLRLTEAGKSRPYICPNCKQPYHYFLSNNTLCGKVPRILPCKHTVCEECVRKCIKTTNHVQCSICLKSEFDKKHLCEYNHYVLGQLTCFRFNKSALDIPNIALVSTDSKDRLTSDKSGSIDQQEKCGFKDCMNPGTISCVDCCGIYCTKCDDALHNSGRQLMSHKRVSVNKAAFELNKCSDHNMIEEIYCKDCNEASCCYCVLEKHEGHSRTYLARLSPDEENELVKAYEIAKLKKKHLLISQKKILESEDTELESQLEIEIGQKFADIHAQLYFIERKLHQEAKSHKNGHSNLVELSKTVRSDINRLNYIINCVDERAAVKFNLRLLLDELKKVQNLPAVLVASEGSGKSQLLIDEQIDNLESFFKIEVPNQVTFALKDVEEIPKEYLEDSVLPEPKPVPNKSSSESDVPKYRSKQYSAKKDDRCKQMPVFVMHINSLESFYVQFKEEDKMYHQLEREISNQVTKNKEGVSIVELKELYLAQRQCDNKRWCRVRVLEEIDDGIRYKVKFIDFGNTAVVSKCEMMYLTSHLASKKPFAYECRLHNPSSFEWPKDTHLKLAQLLDVNKELVMITREFANNIYTVELHINTSAGGLCSVTDLLIFGCDVLGEKPSPTESQQLNQVYDNSDIYICGKSYEVYVRCIIDPWQVYIQKASYENTFRNLIKNMEGFYNNSRCDIHLPLKDSYVVVRFPSKEYGNWHRAKILNVFDQQKMVGVFLLDHGKRVRVPWKDTRKLSQLFKKSECLVVRVKLAAVAPVNADKWSDSDELGVNKFLENHVRNTGILRMLVSCNDPLEVVLFDQQETFDVNINCLLVEKGLVTSTGKLTSTKRWMHKEEEKTEENNILFIKDDTDDEEIEGEIQGVKLQVEIEHFEDPSAFYVSFVSQQKKAEKLHEELQIHFKSQKNFKTDRDWELNDKVVAFDATEKMYYRGIIITKENDKYCVNLLDKPDYLWVDYSKLRSIPTYFANTFPNTVFKCHLANIKPAGDSNKWSKLSVEWFEMLLKKHKEFYIKKISDDDSRSSMPVTMWYSKIIEGTALEPSYRNYVSIDKKVVKAGLAFWINNEVWQNLSRPVEEEEDSRTSQPDELTDNATETTDSSDTIVAAETFKEIKAANFKQWPSALPLRYKEFNAYITCAENEGYLFIREEIHQAAYQEMEKIITENLNSIPKDDSFTLRENQMVMVQSDGCWYRSLVLKVINKTTVHIMMVDFGSDHIVQMNELHNKIMYPEIPIMVSRIKLYDIQSKNKSWTNSEVDTLISTAPQYGKIVIRGSLHDPIPLADVYDMNGVCLNDKLVELCPNLSRSKSREQPNTLKSTNEPNEKHKSPQSPQENNAHKENGAENSYSVEEKVKIEEKTNEDAEEPIYEDAKEELNEDVEQKCKSKENPINEETPKKEVDWYTMVEQSPGHYIYAKIEKKMAEMDIISVYNYKTISLYNPDEGSTEKEFEALTNAISSNVADAKCLEDIQVGMPCLSLFEEDNQWYRAKILRIDAEQCGYVTVIYVDYGNFEIVKITDLKAIPPEWLSFPARFIEATMAYNALKQEQENVLLKHAQSLAGKTKYIEIVDHNPLLVHVYNKVGDVFELHYDAFVRNGIVEI